MALTADVGASAEGWTPGKSAVVDHFATISLDSQRASRLLYHYNDNSDEDNEYSDGTLENSPPLHHVSAGNLEASVDVLLPEIISNGSRLAHAPAAAPSSLRLAEMRSGAEFSAQRFYSSAGSWIFPELLGSCFRPMWNNFFRARNESSLTSSSSNGSGEGEGDGGTAKNTGLEISLEQIDVNFKEDYIGGGNQSSVFRGKFNGRYIALKKLNRASEVDVLTLTSLDHVNIIKTIGVCTRDIYPIIIMEYCERGGLFDVLHNVDVPKTRFIKWASEIVDGMRYLHSRKIVHRDLKSPNILVDSDERLKICDFGSLYAWEKTYMPSVVMSVCGTSQWMSPEMLKNEPCNEKVDVWSFGVVLWELLTQEVPYRSISPMAIMYGVGSGQLKLHVPKSVPSILEMLLGACWARRPRNRPSFVSIATHLANLRVSLADMSDDAWQMRKSVWRREICDENAKRCVFSGNNAKDQEAEELIVKRQHELRHLQELRTVYEQKTERAKRYMREVFAFYDEIRRYEEKLMQRELEIFGKNKSLLHADVMPAFSDSVIHDSNDTRPSRFRNRLLKMEKSMVVCVNDSKNGECQTAYNNCSNKINSCGNTGSFAVVTLSVDDDNASTNPDSRQPRVDLCQHRQKALARRHHNNYDDQSTDEPTESSACSLRGSDEEDGGLNEKYKRLDADASDRIIVKADRHQAPYVALSEFGDNLSMVQLSTNNNNIPTTCPCCQHQFFFSRNSLARASNMSSDSGFGYSEEAATTTRSSTSYCMGELAASSSTNNCGGDDQRSAFQRFHPNNTSIKTSRMCAAALCSSELLTRNRPVHLGAIGRANRISNSSGPRPLNAIRQKVSNSFDESYTEYLHSGHLYRNVQGRWSDSKIKQRGSFAVTPQQKRRTSRTLAHIQSPVEINVVSENLINPVPNAAPRFTRPAPSNLPTESTMASDPSRQTANSKNLIVDNGKDIINQAADSIRCSHNSLLRNHRESTSSAIKDTRMLHHKILNKEAHVNSVNYHHLVGISRETEKKVDTKAEKLHDNSKFFQPQSSSLCRHCARPSTVKRHYSSSQLLTREILPAFDVKNERDCDGRASLNTYKQANDHFEVLQMPDVTRTFSANLFNGGQKDESEPGAANTSATELERSLEDAAANSDGLSDKKHELRAAKSSFKTHRRTASNPTYVPSSSYRTTEICETSTESETDHIYC